MSHAAFPLVRNFVAVNKELLGGGAVAKKTCIKALYYFIGGGKIWVKIVGVEDVLVLSAKTLVVVVLLLN